MTGLSDTDNYNVSVAIVGLCGVMISDPITIYGMYICMHARCVHNYGMHMQIVYRYSYIIASTREQQCFQ